MDEDSGIPANLRKPVRRTLRGMEINLGNKKLETPRTLLEISAPGERGRIVAPTGSLSGKRRQEALIPLFPVTRERFTAAMNPAVGPDPRPGFMNDRLFGAHMRK